jgi:hypothetical protein
VCPRSVGLGLAVGAQLAAQVAQREVGEVEAALPGPGEVGREHGVAGEPGERSPAPTQRVHRRRGDVCGVAGDHPGQ